MTTAQLTERPEAGLRTSKRFSKIALIERVAARTGLANSQVTEVYENLLDEVLDIVAAGDAAVLTGFGRFYRQLHKGHKVSFGQKEVPDYWVLKFSASRSINRRIEQILDATGDAGAAVVELGEASANELAEKASSDSA